MAWEQRCYFEKNDLIYLSKESYFLVPFVSIWSHVSLLFKMLVWFDFLPCLFCFYEEENAYLDERRRQFLLFSVTLFIAFTKCSQWMVLVLSDEVPWVFQLTALCWVKEYFVTVSVPDINVSDMHSQSQSCIRHMKEDIICLVIEQFLFTSFYSLGS